MSYEYMNHAAWLGTREGVLAVGEVLRNIETRLDPAGAAAMNKLWPRSGDSWEMMAAVDRVVEMGVIVEVEQRGVPAGQDRVFVRPRR